MAKSPSSSSTTKNNDAGAVAIPINDAAADSTTTDDKLKRNTIELVCFVLFFLALVAVFIVALALPSDSSESSIVFPLGILPVIVLVASWGCRRYVTCCRINENDESSTSS